MTKPTDHEGAAELLSDWRGAERDTVAAKSALEVARLALKAAESAEAAVLETEVAVKASAEAAERAKAAAERAKRAASEAAQAAQLLAVTASGDLARAKQTKVDEATARDRFQEAQDRGFEPKPG